MRLQCTPRSRPGKVPEKKDRIFGFGRREHEKENEDNALGYE